MTNERVTIVRSAQIWFDGARKAQAEGDMVSALMSMENAFNHTENALAAMLRTVPLVDQPPITGRKPQTIADVRDELAARR